MIRLSSPVQLMKDHYDVVVVSEAPDDETAVRMALAGAMPGNVKSETLRAFPAEEFMKIVAKLP